MGRQGLGGDRPALGKCQPSLPLTNIFGASPVLQAVREEGEQSPVGPMGHVVTDADSGVFVAKVASLGR